MADNSITICGNLTRDPELRFTQGGKAVANFSVAHNRRFMQNGEWVDGPTTYFECVAWEKLGENLTASLTKGLRVIVTGTMESREWEDKEGQTRKAWEIKVDDVGCSFKFATASVERVQRTGGERPPTPADKNVPAGTRVDPVYGDEEPF